ncbi:nuclear transport factor 2 family protein [Streptomyces sp. NPDC002574]|uniref:nuclear transport factor 2 family protein n=1 Tax=Streptomyces sp. NPDC002574 TaxID=3364652 RepID=UPI003693E391
MTTNDERAVSEVLARYVRATDRRDGAAQGALFAEDGIVEILTRTGPDSYERVGEPVIGSAGVAHAVEHFMAPHPPGGTSHHVTADHIVVVEGDDARLSAQFVVFEVRATPRPADGWPEGVLGVQGTVRPTESGYYESRLRRVGDAWRIVHHRVLLDMPIALPAA